MSMQELDAMREALAALEPLATDSRRRAIQWLAEALEVDPAAISGKAPAGMPKGVPDQEEPRLGDGSDDSTSVKEFLIEKDPQNHGDKLAVLAYYSTHFQNLTTFTTNELVDLNLQAGGQRLTNPSRDMDNATRSGGLFNSLSGGAKQLSALGEMVVEALPDHEAVAVLKKERRPKRRAKKATKKATATKKTDK